MSVLLRPETRIALLYGGEDGVVGGVDDPPASYVSAKLLNDDDADYYTMRSILIDGEYHEYIVTPGDATPPTEPPLVLNETDGLYYEYRLINIGGVPHEFFVEPGGAVAPTNAPAIQNDDFGVWHEIRAVTINGEIHPKLVLIPT